MKLSALFIILIFAASTVNYTAKAQSPILWSTAQSGGANNDGTLFNFNTAGNAAAVKHTFSGSTDGSSPNGLLLKAGNGLLYGTTNGGGTSGVGTIFSFSISSGIETLLYSFLSGDSDAQYPSTPLIQATNNLLYGTTTSGGDFKYGTLYSFNTSSNAPTVLYSFGAGNDARDPEGALFQLNDSLLYGLSPAGGNISADGTIYTFNISTGTETVVYNFGSTDTDASGPIGAFIRETDGLLYGLSANGGAYRSGTIFSFNPSTGVETVVHSFGNGTDGSTAYGALIQVTDSLLYGMTTYGGAVDGGTIFSYNIITGNETVLHSFGVAPDGEEPLGSLIQASNGLLYGMTYGGGANGYGMIFSYDIATNTEDSLLSFGINSYGQYPKGCFIEDDATAGINQLSINSTQLSVYPNPFSNQLIVSSNQFINKIDVTNELGQMLFSSAGNLGNKNTIDMSDLPGGIYFIAVLTKTGRTVVPVVKE